MEEFCVILMYMFMSLHCFRERYKQASTLPIMLTLQLHPLVLPICYITNCLIHFQLLKNTINNIKNDSKHAQKNYYTIKSSRKSVLHNVGHLKQKLGHNKIISKTGSNTQTSWEYWYLPYWHSRNEYWSIALLALWQDQASLNWRQLWWVREG